MASKFNDFGVNTLFKDIAASLGFNENPDIGKLRFEKASKNTKTVIPLEFD